MVTMKGMHISAPDGSPALSTCAPSQAPAVTLSRMTGSTSKRGSHAVGPGAADGIQLTEELIDELEAR